MEELVKKLDFMKIELETMSVDELEHKLKIMKECIASLNKPYTFNRYFTINLPSRVSIYYIQKNIRLTRMAMEYNMNHKFRRNLNPLNHVQNQQGPYMSY